jgi:hypothetical protein
MEISGVPVISSFGEMCPGPLPMLLMHLPYNSLLRKFPHCLCLVSADLFLTWSNFAILGERPCQNMSTLFASVRDPYLLISQEEVIHVNHGNDIPILMVVQNESNLLKV